MPTKRSIARNSARLSMFSAPRSGRLSEGGSIMAPNDVRCEKAHVMEVLSCAITRPSVRHPRFVGSK